MPAEVLADGHSEGAGHGDGAPALLTPRVLRQLQQTAGNAAVAVLVDARGARTRQSDGLVAAIPEASGAVGETEATPGRPLDTAEESSPVEESMAPEVGDITPLAPAFQLLRVSPRRRPLPSRERRRRALQPPRWRRIRPDRPSNR